MKISTISVSVLSISTAAIAGPVEEEGHFDMHIQQDGGRLVTGGVDVDEFEFEAGVRVFEAEFGEEGTPNFIDEPGFFANDLLAGTQIGFTISQPLRVWDGTNFDTIAGQTVTAHQAFGVPGSPSVTSPGAFGDRGFGYVAATADAGGFLDEHSDFQLDAPSADGIFLLTLTMWETDGVSSFGHSLPVHIIFGQNVDHEDIEIAEEFVEDNINTLPTPGGAVVALLGASALARRRRA